MIKLPTDIIQIKKMRGGKAVDYFQISKQKKRITIPRKFINTFKERGLDMYISPEQKSLYLLFVDRKKSQFVINEHNGLVGCSDLFNWLNNTNIPVFEDYEYSEYEVDEKNKIVKLKLVRK